MAHYTRHKHWKTSFSCFHFSEWHSQHLFYIYSKFCVCVAGGIAYYAIILLRFHAYLPFFHFNLVFCILFHDKYISLHYGVKQFRFFFSQNYQLIPHKSNHFKNCKFLWELLRNIFIGFRFVKLLTIIIYPWCIFSTCC